MLDTWEVEEGREGGRGRGGRSRAATWPRPCPPSPTPRPAMAADTATPTVDTEEEAADLVVKHDVVGARGEYWSGRKTVVFRTVGFYKKDYGRQQRIMRYEL